MLPEFVALFVVAILPALATAGEIATFVFASAFSPRVTLSFARSDVPGQSGSPAPPAIAARARASRAPPRETHDTQ